MGLSRMLRIPKDQGPSATGTSSSSIAYKESDSEKAEELYREARLAFVRGHALMVPLHLSTRPAALPLNWGVRGKGPRSKRVTQLFGVMRTSLQGKTR